MFTTIMVLFILLYIFKPGWIGGDPQPVAAEVEEEEEEQEDARDFVVVNPRSGLQTSEEFIRSLHSSH